MIYELDLSFFPWQKKRENPRESDTLHHFFPSTDFSGHFFVPLCKTNGAYRITDCTLYRLDPKQKAVFNSNFPRLQLSINTSNPRT